MRCSESPSGENQAINGAALPSRANDQPHAATVPSLPRAQLSTLLWAASGMERAALKTTAPVLSKATKAAGSEEGPSPTTSAFPLQTGVRFEAKDSGIVRTAPEATKLAGWPRAPTGAARTASATSFTHSAILLFPIFHPRQLYSP